MGVQESSTAPGFVSGDSIGEYYLSFFSPYVGHKNVVLYFYPKDDTPGCTKEAQDFRDKYESFLSLNTVIVGVSKDGISSHENFKRKYGLPFELLSDENADLARAYGVWVEKSMFGKTYMGIERATFLIDTSGTIRKIWRNVKVQDHVDEVLKEVGDLGFHGA